MTQANETTQSKFVIIESIDKIDGLQSRLAFVMNGIAQPSDWIDEKAAAGLFCTIQSIWCELGDVRNSIDAIRTERMA